MLLQTCSLSEAARDVDLSNGAAFVRNAIEVVEVVAVCAVAAGAIVANATIRLEETVEVIS